MIDLRISLSSRVFCVFGENNEKYEALLDEAYQEGIIVLEDCDHESDADALIDGDILGFSSVDVPLHVVIASNGETAKIVTAYHPDKDKWETDMKTRKEQNL